MYKNVIIVCSQPRAPCSITRCVASVKVTWEIRAWINNYVHTILWGVITHPYPNFNGAVYPNRHWSLAWMGNHYGDADQRKHQSPASLSFVWGIHRDRWIPRTNGQLRGKCFHLMTSSCYIPSFYDVVITYPCSKCSAGLAYLKMLQVVLPIPSLTANTWSNNYGNKT